MKFEIQVQHKGTTKPANVWVEQYDEIEIETQAQAEARGREFIEGFNASLRPHERAREFISATITGPSDPPDYDIDEPEIEDDQEDDDDFWSTSDDRDADEQNEDDDE